MALKPYLAKPWKLAFVYVVWLDESGYPFKIGRSASPHGRWKTHQKRWSDDDPTRLPLLPLRLWPVPHELRVDLERGEALAIARKIEPDNDGEERFAGRRAKTLLKALDAWAADHGFINIGPPDVKWRKTPTPIREASAATARALAHAT